MEYYHLSEEKYTNGGNGKKDIVPRLVALVMNLLFIPKCTKHTIITKCLQIFCFYGQWIPPLSSWHGNIRPEKGNNWNHFQSPTMWEADSDYWSLRLKDQHLIVYSLRLGVVVCRVWMLPTNLINNYVVLCTRKNLCGSRALNWTFFSLGLCT